MYLSVKIRRQRGLNLPVIVMCSLLMGCGGALKERFFISSGILDGENTDISKLAKFSVGGVTVAVRPDNAISIDMGTRKIEPRNYRFSAAYADRYLLPLDANDPFVIEILFSTQSYDVSFDWMGVELQTNRGKGRPLKIYNLLPRYSTIHSLDPAIPLCRRPDTLSAHPGFSTLSKYEHKSTGPLYLARGTIHCIAVAFDVSRVDPRANFALTSTAMYVDRTRIDMPKIYFLPREYTLH